MVCLLVGYLLGVNSGLVLKMFFEGIRQDGEFASCNFSIEFFKF